MIWVHIGLLWIVLIIAIFFLSWAVGRVVKIDDGLERAHDRIDDLKYGKEPPTREDES